MNNYGAKKVTYDGITLDYSSNTNLCFLYMGYR